MGKLKTCGCFIILWCPTGLRFWSYRLHSLLRNSLVSHRAHSFWSYRLRSLLRNSLVSHRAHSFWSYRLHSLLRNSLVSHRAHSFWSYRLHSLLRNSLVSHRAHSFWSILCFVILWCPTELIAFGLIVFIRYFIILWCSTGLSSCSYRLHSLLYNSLVSTWLSFWSNRLHSFLHNSLVSHRAQLFGLIVFILYSASFSSLIKTYSVSNQSFADDTPSCFSPVLLIRHTPLS